MAEDGHGRVPHIKALVLDAAPLLTQARIAGLANKYYIPPSVLAELRDVRARDYLQHLQATGQIELEVRAPGAEALRCAIDFAKQTGDYAVLSAPDVHVLALTYALEVEMHGTWHVRDVVGGKTGQQQYEAKRLAEKGERKGAADSAVQKTDATLEKDSATQPDTDGFTVVDAAHGFDPSPKPAQAIAPSPVPLPDEEDNEQIGGEWITPTNITKHKNKALGLVVDESVLQTTEPRPGRRRRGRDSKRSGLKNMSVACMTADFAVQNALLQMGLNLVSTDGMQIERVKSWVLRCHACYKYVSCTDGDAGMQVHLKPNFQYKNRGTRYSLPLPQPGSSSGGRPSGSSKNPKTGVPILREDQPEWQRGLAKQRIQQNKEERELQKSLAQGKDSLSAWYADPDWMPEMLMGRQRNANNDLPALGIGRKNPNERRRRKK
ncbi:Nob1p [Malassezia vespertilionis]|uniref:20S-pre-rRNA D-site endonuclease NOB1 n=1 Tax=Malassezia vespertilionis TaxID=2020962 RepID=A0A2N1JAQ3_9BASI|nr:Nob1p [Malassezia vespertilionis]